MIFYSSLFYLIICLNKILGLLEIRFNIENECSVRLETDKGIETCFNQQCSDYKDPWRILSSHIQDQPCYLHYLKLSFSSYDQLLVFIELQTSDDNSLDQFFNTKDRKYRMLEIEIDAIYPFNKKYFLSENMLNKLGGRKGNIDILQIEIKKWYKSPRSVVQIIETDLIARQPFQQITILYRCNIHQTMEKLVLAKYLRDQGKSSCPTQINIIQNKNFSIPVNYTINQLINISFNNKSYIEKLNLTDHLFNRSVFYYNKKKKYDEWNLFAKIGIVVVLITLIIAFGVYHFIYSRRQSTNNN